MHGKTVEKLTNFIRVNFVEVALLVVSPVLSNNTINRARI